MVTGYRGAGTGEHGQEGPVHAAMKVAEVGGTPSPHLNHDAEGEPEDDVPPVVALQPLVDLVRNHDQRNLGQERGASGRRAREHTPK